MLQSGKSRMSPLPCLRNSITLLLCLTSIQTGKEQDLKRAHQAFLLKGKMNYKSQGHTDPQPYLLTPFPVIWQCILLGMEGAGLSVCHSRAVSSATLEVIYFY